MAGLTKFGQRRIQALVRGLPLDGLTDSTTRCAVTVPTADREDGLERNDHLVSGDFRSRFEHLSRYSDVCKSEWQMAADIGCGTGYGTSLLSDRGIVIGLDVSEEAIRYARERYPDCDFVVGTGGAIPLGYESCEAITAFEVIEHIPEPNQLLDEFSRILKKGGTLFLSSPNPAHIGNLLQKTLFRIPIPDKVDMCNQYHVREFTYDEMLSTISAHGFELVWSAGQTLPLDQFLPGANHIIRRVLELLHLTDVYDYILSKMGRRFPRLSWTVVYAVRRSDGRS